MTFGIVCLLHPSVEPGLPGYGGGVTVSGRAGVPPGKAKRRRASTEPGAVQSSSTQSVSRTVELGWLEQRSCSARRDSACDGERFDVVVDSGMPTSWTPDADSGQAVSSTYHDVASRKHTSVADAARTMMQAPGSTAYA